MYFISLLSPAFSRLYFSIFFFFYKLFLFFLLYLQGSEISPYPGAFVSGIKAIELLSCDRKEREKREESNLSQFFFLFSSLSSSFSFALPPPLRPSNSILLLSPAPSSPLLIPDSEFIFRVQRFPLSSVAAAFRTSEFQSRAPKGHMADFLISSPHSGIPPHSGLSSPERSPPPC